MMTATLLIDMNYCVTVNDMHEMCGARVATGHSIC